MQPVLSPLLSWSGDVPAVALVTLLAVAYGAGVRTLVRRGLPWPLWRTLSWAGGLVAVLAVSATGIDRDAHALLWLYTVQVVVLLLFAPVLLAYGRPMTLVGDLLPSRGAPRQLLPGPLRLLAAPVAGPLAVPVVLFALYFTPLLGATRSSAVAWQAVHLALLGIGLLLAFGLVGEGGRAETSMALAATVAICFAELLLDALPGIALRFSPTPLVPTAWGGLQTLTGLTPLDDQHRAADLLWTVAELVDVPFLAILVRRWVRTDELEARRLDAMLEADTAAAARRSGIPGAAVGPDAVGVPGPVSGRSELQRPWWETDRERLGGHRVARELEAEDG